MANPMEKQIDMLRSQMDDMRSRLDQVSKMAGEYGTKGGHLMEGARGKAVEAGQMMGEQKGFVLPFGLLFTFGLMAVALWIFYPDVGQRLKSMVQSTAETEHLQP